MDALVGPGVEVVKTVGSPFLRQIDYYFHYKKYVENLRRRVKNLINTRSELQKVVDVDENNLKSIKKSVKDWFESVHKETTQDETMQRLNLRDDETTFNVIDQQSYNGWWCCRARWNIGRYSLKKMAIIDDLLNQGKGFLVNSVSDPSPPVGTEFVPANEDFEDFESRKSSINQIMVALKDDKTNLVGVYGMGGVGKTMLVNQVHKLVMEEKLFHAVAVTTVSEKDDLKDIQNEIAKQLGFNRIEETDNISKRAEMLHKRLMRPDQKFLVILDDVWTTTELTNLSVVGIPYGKNCCKVILTTNNLDVCNSLKCHKNIEVGLLTEKESWQLFKKNVGEDVVNSPELHSVARDIANECGKLPIALVTIGRALRNKDKTAWDDTADQLKSSDYSDIHHKVFKPIKLSYDHLGNKFLKKCFLLCSLFPEDHRISIAELMVYVIGDYEILENHSGSTLKKVRRRLHTMLNKLMASCLLFGHKEDGGRISKVWMHDIVRYVALKIASEEGSGFFAKVGVGLKDWPESQTLLSGSNTSKCLRVSLMRNEISALPDQSEVPDHLLCLSLEGNASLKKIPNSFFEKAGSLATLNLSETGISSLPTSLSCLMNLRSLHLGKCSLHEIDVSIIGKLKKLEILNLSGCRLSSLPKEIGEFSNLRLLDLSNNDNLNIIPPNVISRLSCLEELYMFDSFHGWEVEQTGDGKRASLHEVSSLRFLNSLELDITNDGINASISIGSEFKERCSSIIGTVRSPVCHSFKVLLARVDDLMLSNCTGLKSVGQLVIDDGFKNMKILAVKGCNEMEYLFPTLDMVLALNQLEELKICYCEGMTGIVAPHEETVLKDQLVLPNLRQLVIKGCKRLKDLYPLTKLSHGGLSQLRRLKVKDCKSLVEILINTDEEKDHDGKAMLPQLQKLSLKNLPSLKTIWKGTIPIGSFQNLRKVKIRNCSDSLKHLIFPVSLVLGGGLSQLEILKINNCKGLKAIIECDKQELHHPVFPRLKKMVLMNLPNLTTIAKEVIMSFRSFENLEDLWVEKCNNLKYLLPMRLLVNGGLTKLKYLYVEECNEMEVIFNEDGGDHGKTSITEKKDGEDHGKMVVAFPHLKGLALISLPKLSIFHQGEPILDWPSLLLLIVSRCENLNRLPLDHHHSLHKLKLIVGDTKRWFDEELEWENQSLKSLLRPLFMNIEDDEEGIRRKLNEIKQKFEIEDEEGLER